MQSLQFSSDAIATVQQRCNRYSSAAIQSLHSSCDAVATMHQRCTLLKRTPRTNVAQRHSDITEGVAQEVLGVMAPKARVLPGQKVMSGWALKSTKVFQRAGTPSGSSSSSACQPPKPLSQASLSSMLSRSEKAPFDTNDEDRMLQDPILIEDEPAEQKDDEPPVEQQKDDEEQNDDEPAEQQKDDEPPVGNKGKQVGKKGQKLGKKGEKLHKKLGKKGNKGNKAEKRKGDNGEPRKKGKRGRTGSFASLEQEPPATAAIDVIPEYKDDPVCCKCKVKVDPLRARVTGKRQGCWQCPKCASRYTQLHRTWGGWPPSAWESFSEDEKAKFWRDIGASEGKDEQEKVVMEMLSKKVIESRKSGSGGEYLPLSVYGTRGFDVKAIENGCDDWKPHKLFGRVYKVEIEYQSKEQEEQRIRDAILQSIQHRKATCPSPGRVGGGRVGGRAFGASSKGHGRGGGVER